MRATWKLLCRCYLHTEKRRRLALVAGALYLAGLVAVVLAVGCATSPRGIAREQVWYRAGTNIVGNAQQVVPYLPPPAQVPVEALLGAATAALAAWNAHQQKQIKRLKNGNGNGHGPTSVPAASPPTRT